MLPFDMAEAKPRTSHICIRDKLILFFVNYDRQMELQQNQLTYLQQAQNSLRRAAPVISELLDRVGPNVPNYEFLYEPRALLTQMHQRLADQERLVNEGLQPPPPYMPNDDYGFLRRPESHIPAPMLRRSLRPRSCSAPAKLQRVTNNYLGDQPWPHVDPQDYTVFQAWRTAARVFMQTDQALGIPDTAP